MDQTKKILIVEDEVALANVLADRLMAEGYGIIKAANGQEGLDKALAEHPNLILLDINMPVMNGIDMLKSLRQDEYGKKVEVVLLTNVNEYQSLADTLAEGAHDYLIKSDWKLDDVVKLVDSKLKK